MFKTPPLQGTSSGFTAEHSFFETPRASSKDKQAQWLKTLPTPASTDSSFTTPTKRPDISLDTSFDTSFDTSIFSRGYSEYPFATPDVSPTENLFGSKLVQTPISPLLSSPDIKKNLPFSTRINESDVLHELGDSILDEKLDFELKLTRELGRGAYSTVLECSTHDEKFAIKIPNNMRKSKFVLKEMLNYKIIQQYLTSNGFSLRDFPILNAYGLTFMTKQQYRRLRVNETVPCLIAPCVPSTLDTLISTSYPSTTQSLHIGDDAWWTLAKQLIMCLIVLRDCHMLHMDFKTSNILFDPSTSDFKVADFTSASLMEDVHAEYITKLQDGVFFDVTLQYCAPELIASPPTAPSYDSDLYAVGLILLSAAIGQEPYADVIKAQGTSSTIYLSECIRKNKVLDLMSDKAHAILDANADAKKLISMILRDRVALNDVVEFVNSL